MKNKGMTTRTVLIREESILCAMDEKQLCLLPPSVACKHACPALSRHCVQPTRHLSTGQSEPGSKGGKEFVKCPGVQH